MNTIKQYREFVESALASIPWPASPEKLYDSARYALSGGGKRLRPVLTLAFTEIFNKPLDDGIAAALAVEIFHNFTLVHDDIMDKSPTRHGRESVWARYGEPTAILAGDVLASMPVNLLALSYKPEKARRLLGEYQGITARVLDGQQQDMDMELRDDATLEDYIEMVSNKTGALFHLACSIGALAADRDMDDAVAAGAYGRNLGIAFQIQDDLLDTYGDPTTFGKPIGGDILNDKNTILRVTAMEKAPGEMKRIADAGLQGEEKIKAVREVYDSLGLKDTCISLIKEFTEEAIDSLKPLKLRKEKNSSLSISSKVLSPAKNKRVFSSIPTQ